jgi:hypothetical protein
VAAGYRLAGEALGHVCCRHLYGDDRMLTVWPSNDDPIVILVAPHDRASGDVYAQLLEALNLAVPVDEREKPPCCDQAGHSPAAKDVATEIADAIERRARALRRRR